jgi:hypothetical protein
MKIILIAKVLGEMRGGRDLHTGREDHFVGEEVPGKKEQITDDRPPATDSSRDKEE